MLRKIKHIRFIGVLILMTIVSVGIAGILYFVINNNQRNNSSIVTPSLTPSPTSSQQSPAPSGWTTYSDDKLGLTFSYPSEMAKSPYREGSYQGISLVLIGPTQMASGRTQSSLSEGAIFRLLAIPDTDAYREITEMRNKELNVPEGDPIPLISPIEEITLAGRKAFQYKVEGMGNVKVTYLQLGSKVLEVTTHFEGFSEAEIKYYEDLTDQILHTIKITDTTKNASECLAAVKCANDMPCMANPAAVFCTCMGGTSQIIERSDGQYGICIIDGNQFNEWEYYRNAQK
jgi:putative hemolysin